MVYHAVTLTAVALLLHAGSRLDIFILLGCGLLKKKSNLAEAFNNFHLNLAIVTVKTLAVIWSSLAILQVVRYVRGLKKPSTPTDEFPIPPMFFPCQTTHRRMFPVKHDFSYSYLLTGVPIGLKGSAGGMISVDEDRESFSWLSWLSWIPWGTWYRVHGDNYLARGHHPDGLRGKLRDFLQSQGIECTQYSHAYLLTAARFMNYSSNPVSIWHLYSATNELRALVLEVNNTFDERRSYFLEPSSNVTDSEYTGEKVSNLKQPRYSSTWPKDFYVSTFNDRSGSYSLSASDPFSPHLTGTGHINSTITLSGPLHQNAMLIARIFSICSPLDPTTMSVWQKTKFLAQWWWVGFATFPRTINEAVNLLVRRKLPWAFRPEPKRDTMSRRADDLEVSVERQFRRFLKSKIEVSEEALILRYISAGLVGSDEHEVVMCSPRALNAEEVEMRIFTPAFYSCLVQYAFVTDALLSESSENRPTISISHPSIIPKMQLDTMVPDLRTSPNPGMFDKLCFSFLSYLRRPISIPTKTNHYSSPSSSSSAHVLDIFVLRTAHISERRSYCHNLLHLMISAHVAFGSREILDLEFAVIKAWVIWGLVGKL